MVALPSLRELAQDPMPIAQVGGKAANLARLVAAGLPVPDGFVVPAAADPAPAALVAAAAGLGARLAVRSSASIEDGAELTAAGLFASELAVAPADLAAAIARVRRSASSTAVAAYLARRGRADLAVAMAVIVQREVTAPISGVLYSRGLVGDDDAWLEARDPSGELVRLAIAARATGAVRERDPGFPLTDGAIARLVELGRAAERAIGAERGADVEWLWAEGGPVVVQARPLAARAPAGRALGAEFGFSCATPTVVWRWDVGHNPEPLSPAQIGLVERVAASAPAPMRVVDGYLYAADAPATDAPAADAPATDALATDALARLYDETERAIDRALAPIEAVAAPPLADALAAYDRAYAAYAGLAPALARARRALGDRVAAAPANPLGRAVARCAAGDLDRAALDRLAAPLAPAWDVACPTYGERPAEIDRALAAARRAPPRPPIAAPDDPRLAAVLALGEADDALLYRAQALVRRALLALAASLGLADDDVFYLSLAELVAGTVEPARAGARAAAARAVRDAQRRRAMPLAVQGGRPLGRSARPAVEPEMWRGRGTGGSVRGRVVRADDLGQLTLPAGDAPSVVVARTLTPPMVVAIAGAAAVVSDHGSLLGHAASIARELGVPCVVGCGSAWAALTDGDEVVLDGDAGLVVRLPS